MAELIHVGASPNGYVIGGLIGVRVLIRFDCSG